MSASSRQEDCIFQFKIPWGPRGPRTQKWSHQIISTLDGSYSRCRDHSCAALVGGAQAYWPKISVGPHLAVRLIRGSYLLIRSPISTNRTCGAQSMCGSIVLHLVPALLGDELHPLYWASSRSVLCGGEFLVEKSRPNPIHPLKWAKPCQLVRVYVAKRSKQEGGSF